MSTDSPDTARSKKTRSKKPRTNFAPQAAGIRPADMGLAGTGLSTMSGTEVPGKARCWEVLHGCEDATTLFEVVDAQLAVGMRPYIVTPNGVLRRQEPAAKAQKTSLIQMWQEVRRWRKHLEDVASQELDVVHAHCFAAGMASVRGRLPVVYDIGGFIEDIAAAAGQAGERSWLARSFRTAEQHVLTQAGALVVHSQTLRQQCIERGAMPENVFIVPHPVRPGSEPPPSNFFQQNFGFAAGTITLLADESAQDRVLLQAFALLRQEVPEAKLFFASDDRGVISAVHFQAGELQVDDAVFVIGRQDEEAALASADIVVAGAGAAAASARGPSARERLLMAQPGRTALAAMLRCRPLLAADAATNREVSPEGRGCLWYRTGDARDLAHRASFLARNAEFRAALAQSAHQHLMASRDPEKIGLMYDEVYRHAYSRRASGAGGSSGGVRLIPVQQAG